MNGFFNWAASFTQAGTFNALYCGMIAFFFIVQSARLFFQSIKIKKNTLLAIETLENAYQDEFSPPTDDVKLCRELKFKHNYSIINDNMNKNAVFSHC